jgi:hypothetical protein
MIRFAPGSRSVTLRRFQREIEPTAGCRKLGGALIHTRFSGERLPVGGISARPAPFVFSAGGQSVGPLVSSRAMVATMHQVDRRSPQDGLH